VAFDFAWAAPTAPKLTISKAAAKRKPKQR